MSATRRAVIAVAALTLGLVAFLAIARLSARDLDTIGSDANPVVFLLSASHARNGSPESRAAIAQGLSAHSGLSVVVEVAKDPVGSVEAFGTERADFGLLTLTEYFLARQEFGVGAALQVLRERAPGNAYFAVLVVRADSDVQDAAGLRGRHVAFVDQFSVSGFAYPAVLLKDVNVVPEFAGSHEGAVQLLKDGRAVAAATYEELVEGDASLKVVARTPAIPNEPIVARRGLPSDVSTKVVAALNALPQSPQGRAALQDVAGIVGFAAANDASFDGVLATLREGGRSADALVPGGRALVLRNSPLLNPGPN
jgi:phosphonate transport system substrate-binding protein